MKDQAAIDWDTFFGRNEVRVINAVTGGEKGRKPERYGLLPWKALNEVARVYAHGAEKYADNNWRKGYDWSLSIDAAFRHMAAFAAGEDDDPESGFSHAAHATFHMLALITYATEHPELDDRFKVDSERPWCRDDNCKGKCHRPYVPHDAEPEHICLCEWRRQRGYIDNFDCSECGKQTRDNGCGDCGVSF